jgi:glutamate carboxypeptidase
MTTAVSLIRGAGFGATFAALAFGAIALVPAPLGAAPGGSLSASERRAIAGVDRRVPEALALLERAVNVNSGTLNFEGVRRVGALFREPFTRLGFEVRWVDGGAFGRAGHLIAVRPGKSAGPWVLLIGHLDTVFEPDHPFQRFERTSDSTARGPGVIDMKGGIVVMLMALQALAESGGLDRMNVTVVLTGDEEKAGTPLELARRDLLDAARGANVAIGFEDGDGDPHHAVVARRGTTEWALRVAGTPAHSSQIFRDDIGSGAVFEAARILSAFHDSLRGEPYLTFNPGLVLGGTRVVLDSSRVRGTASGKTNVIAESTIVVGDLRTLTLEQRDRVKQTMRRLAAAHLPHTSASLVFDDGYPPLARADGNRRLLAMYDQASRDLGLGPVTEVDPMRAGAADISFTAGLVPMALDGIGLRGDGGHTAAETANLKTLPHQAKRVALTLLRLADRWKDGAAP